MINGNDLKTILTVLFLGISFGAVYAFYQKKFLGDFIRALISSKATDPNMSKSLAELGYKKNSLREKMLKLSLKENSVLLKYAVKSEGKFYLPVEKLSDAEKRFDNKGTTLTAVFLTIAVFLLVAVISTYVIPTLNNMAKNMFSSFSKVNENGYTDFEEDKTALDKNTEITTGGTDSNE